LLGNSTADSANPFLLREGEREPNRERAHKKEEKSGNKNANRFAASDHANVELIGAKGDRGGGTWRLGQ